MTTYARFGARNIRLRDVRSLAGQKVASAPRYDSAMQETIRHGGLNYGVEWTFRGEAPEPIFVVRRVTKDSARIEDMDGNVYSDLMPIRAACALLRDT